MAKLSPYQLMGMYGLGYDKHRLHTGKSTANVANLTAIIEAAAGIGRHELPPNEGRNDQGQVSPAKEAGNQQVVVEEAKTALASEMGHYVNHRLSGWRKAKAELSTGQVRPKRRHTTPAQREAHRTSAREWARRRKTSQGQPLAQDGVQAGQIEAGGQTQGVGGDGEP